MKFFLVFCVFLWIPTVTAVQASETKDTPVFHIGLSSATFDTVKQNDAIAALKVWTDTIIKEQGLKEKAEVKFFNSSEELSQVYNNNQVDIVSLSTEDSIRLGLIPDFVYLPARESGSHVSYSIIVHRKAKFQDLGKLRNKKLVVFTANQMLLARFWLKCVLTKHAPEVAKNSLKNLISVDSPSKAILQVFFRQADAAVVTTDTFELACELNPQLRKDIQVLSSSPPFIVSFLLFRPTWTGASRDRVESAIIDLHTTPGGRQVLNVFKSSRMEKHPGAILNSTREFLIENLYLFQNSSFR